MQIVSIGDNLHELSKTYFLGKIRKLFQYVVCSKNLPRMPSVKYLLLINVPYLQLLSFPLRKHAYSNILRILPPKYKNFQMKNSDIFLISDQNIDCGYSLEPPR